MGNLFSASEIVKLGIQIEKNGKAFYDAAAAAASDPSAKELFAYLGNEEVKHEKAFEAMLPRMRDYEPPENYGEEYAEYMRSLAGEHVFTKEGAGVEAAGRVKGDLEALDLAIGFEKDSILMFHEMKRFVDKHEHSFVDNLIEQEQEHLVKLTRIKAGMAGK